jgi:hypothetical protein
LYCRLSKIERRLDMGVVNCMHFLDVLKFQNQFLKFSEIRAQCRHRDNRFFFAVDAHQAQQQAGTYLARFNIDCVICVTHAP